jgi:hypothetical protein
MYWNLAIATVLVAVLALLIYPVYTGEGFGNKRARSFPQCLSLEQRAAGYGVPMVHCDSTYGIVDNSSLYRHVGGVERVGHPFHWIPRADNSSGLLYTGAV